MLNSQDQRTEHTRYGFVLCFHELNGCNYLMLFTTVGQINHRGQSVICNPKKSLQVATINLEAGYKAMEMTDFVSALSFFEYRISYLKNNWQLDYDLNLEFFNCCTKSAYAVGDHDKLKLCLDEVLAFGRCFKDKLVVLYYSVSALCNSSVQNKAITKAVWILSMLGEDLRQTFSCNESLVLIEETRKILVEVSDDALMKCKTKTTSSRIMATKFLLLYGFPLFVVKFRFFYKIVVLQMVKLTLLYGMVPVSGIRFEYFGSILAALGQLREGYCSTNFVKKPINCLIQRKGRRDDSNVITDHWMH